MDVDRISRVYSHAGRYAPWRPACRKNTVASR